MNKNLNELIKILEQKKNDYYLISTYDEYLFEYVSEKNMRLKWLTNFSGTNGIALISKKKNIFLLMVDTYFRQKKSYQSNLN